MLAFDFADWIIDCDRNDRKCLLLKKKCCFDNVYNNTTIQIGADKGGVQMLYSNTDNLPMLSVTQSEFVSGMNAPSQLAVIFEVEGARVFPKPASWKRAEPSVEEDGDEGVEGAE